MSKLLLLLLLVLYISFYYFIDVDCGEIPGLEHGSVAYIENRTTHGAVAKFSCNLNYTLIGEDKRVCGDEGIWTGKQPQCLCKYI